MFKITEIVSLQYRNWGGINYNTRIWEYEHDAKCLNASSYTR